MMIMHKTRGRVLSGMYAFALCAAVLAGTVASPRPASALLCAMTSVDDLLSGPHAADVIFRGVARENKGRWTRFEVTRSWAGVTQGPLWVERGKSTRMTPINYKIGGDYLVIASIKDARVFVTPCNQAVLDERFSELIHRLGLR